MFLFRDQLGREIKLASYPKRIISIVPSQTELLFDLGLDEDVVGITKFCVHPHHWFHVKKRIGGTKRLDLPAIESLQPDLILANKEENTRDQVEMLAERYNVWISDVGDLTTAIEMIISVGEITDRAQKAILLADQIKEAFQQLQTSNKTGNGQTTRPIRAAYLIWKNPVMTVGWDTFIHAMMKCAGLANIFDHFDRYPIVSIDDIRSTNCELLLLPSEPYPFSEKDLKALQPLFPNTRLMLVDGEMFSWYGSRLLKAANYFKELKSGL